MFLNYIQEKEEDNNVEDSNRYFIDNNLTF